MANSDKNILITPATGSSTEQPRIVFSGADATTGPQNITARGYITGSAGNTGSGTLAFEGSTGQLLTVTNSITGGIFSVNDRTGVPLLETFENGNIKVAENGIGRFSYPRCPSFFVRQTTGQNGFTANAVANWDVQRYNNGGHFSGSKFTAPWQGIYYFSSHMDCNGGVRLFMRFLKNGSSIDGTYAETYTPNGTWISAQISTVLDLDPGDYVEVYIASNNAYGGSWAHFLGFQVA